MASELDTYEPSSIGVGVIKVFAILLAKMWCKLFCSRGGQMLSSAPDLWS